MIEKEQKKNSQNKLLVPILSIVTIVLVFCLGFVFGRSGFDVVWEDGEFAYSFKGQLYPENKEINFNLFWEVWEMIETNYVEKDVDRESMFYGAIKGMVGALDDPATRFYTPEETEEYEFERSGGLEGVGIELGYLDDGVVIKQVFDDSPAQENGLQKGDIIVGVDSEDVRGWDIYEIAKIIRGEKGTSVNITVMRSEEEISFDITRDAVYIKSIEWEMLEDGNALITVRRFTESNFSDFAALWDEVIDEVSAQNPGGIIIDLRGNGGGYLDGAVYLGGEFLEEGDVVLYVRNRDEKDTPHKVAREGAFQDIPLVILVDGGTASSSEIFAGALQYYDRAVIIGEETYGKGTAQDVVKPSSWGGSSLHLTTQKWLLPDKGWINKEDLIQPDIEVEVTIEQMKKGEDPQMDEAVKELANSR